MKTNFKNCVRSLICFALCLMLCISQLCIVTFAENENVTKIFYRDYEDYTDGKAFTNTADNAYGIATASESGSFLSTIEAVQGNNGTGVNFSKMTNSVGGTVKNGSFFMEMNKQIDSGILYFAFDVKMSSKTVSNSTAYINLERVGNATMGGTEPNQYKTANGNAATVIGFYGKDQNLRGYSPYGESFSKTKLKDSPGLTDGYNRVEITVELNKTDKTQKYTYFLNGVKLDEITAEEKSYTDPESAVVYDGLSICYGEMFEYFDNFTILHFANSPAADEKIKVSGEDAYVGEKELTVKFTDEELGAGVLVPNITKNSVVVTDSANPANSVKVTAVREGSKTGEYVLTTEAPLTAGTYSVTVTGVSDTIGRTIKTTDNANVVSVNVVNRVTKIFYRDYEGGTYLNGGNFFMNTSDGYGSLTPVLKNDEEGGNYATAGSVATNAKRIENQKNGVGFDLYTGNTSNTTKATSGKYNFKTDGSSFESGVLYFGFTVKPNYDVTNTATNEGPTFFKIKDSSDALHSFLAIAVKNDSYNTGNTGDLLGGTVSGSNTWIGTSTGVRLDVGTTYDIEVLFDIAGKNIKYFVDGAEKLNLDMNNKIDVKGFEFELSHIINYFDNFTILHYANSPAEDAKIQAALPEKLYAEASSFNITFTDTELKDSRSGNYAAALVSSVKTEAKLMKGTDEVAVSITEAASGATGEYTVALSSGAVLEEGVYTLVLDEVHDTVGRTAENVSFTVYDPYKCEIDSFNIKKGGAELSDLSGLAVGDAVSVNASIKPPHNDGTPDYNVYVICALYKNNILQNANVGTITFNTEEDIGEAVSGNAEIVLPEGFVASADDEDVWEIKGFLWNTDVKPLIINKTLGETVTN